MTDRDTLPDDQDEIDLLLPWYATDRLSPEERERVRRALDAEPARETRLALAREEQGETIAVAEALPRPSGRARDDLFARIEAIEGARNRAKPASAQPGGVAAGPAGLAARLLAWIETLGPRPIALAGFAAALLVVVQTGWIAGTLVAPTGGGTYTTASHDEARDGSFALVAFAPGATAAQITALLAEREMTIADGPRAGGLYRVRLSAKALGPQERDGLIALLRARPDVVGFVAPSI